MVKPKNSPEKGSAGTGTQSRNKSQSLFQLGVVFAVIVLINIIASFIFFRFDLTSEKRYSLNPATKKLISELPDEVYIKVYLEGEFPAGFKRLRNETREMLNEFRAYSKAENIQYEFINPNESSDRKKRNEIYKQLVQLGLQPTNLEVKEESGQSQQIIFPGALVSYNGKTVPVQLLKSQLGASPDVMLNNSIQALEYEFASAIRKLTEQYKPKIAFIDGHGELDTNEVKDITEGLSEFYTVERRALDGKLRSLDGIEGAIIAKPDSAFSEKDKFIIDQFVMRGGKLLWLLDPVFASMDSMGQSGVTVGLGQNLNLDDILFKYGVRLNTNLVQDLQAAPIPIVVGVVANQPQQKMFPWPYFPLIMPANNHPIINNLNAVKLEFASTLDTVGPKELKKTILLSTSRYTKLIQTPARISLGMLQHQPDVNQYKRSFQPVGVLLEGPFNSVFKNRIPPQIEQDKSIGYKERSNSSKMIVIADGDVIKNYFNRQNGKSYPLGFDRFTNQQYGNRNFILNCMNYLMDDSGLITVRARELKLRMLDRERIKAEKGKWQGVAVAVPVLFVIAFGLVTFNRRRKKYGN